MQGGLIVDKIALKDVRFWPKGELYVTGSGTVMKNYDEDHYITVEMKHRTKAGKEYRAIVYTNSTSHKQEEIELHRLVALLFCKRDKKSKMVYTRSGNLTQATQGNLYWNGNGNKDDSKLSRKAYEDELEQYYDKHGVPEGAPLVGKYLPKEDPVPLADDTAQEMETAIVDKTGPNNAKDAGAPAENEVVKDVVMPAEKKQADKPVEKDSFLKPADLDVLPEDFVKVPGEDALFINRDAVVYEKRGNAYLHLEHRVSKMNGYENMHTVTCHDQNGSWCQRNVSKLLVQAFLNPENKFIRGVRYRDGNADNLSLDNLMPRVNGESSSLPLPMDNDQVEAEKSLADDEQIEAEKLLAFLKKKALREPGVCMIGGVRWTCSRGDVPVGIGSLIHETNMSIPKFYELIGILERTDKAVRKKNSSSPTSRIISVLDMGDDPADAPANPHVQDTIPDVAESETEAVLNALPLSDTKPANEPTGEKDPKYASMPVMMTIDMSGQTQTEADAQDPEKKHETKPDKKVERSVVDNKKKKIEEKIIKSKADAASKGKAPVKQVAAASKPDMQEKASAVSGNTVKSPKGMISSDTFSDLIKFDELDFNLPRYAGGYSLVEGEDYVKNGNVYMLSAACVLWIFYYTRTTDFHRLADIMKMFETPYDDGIRKAAAKAVDAVSALAALIGEK